MNENRIASRKKRVLTRISTAVIAAAIVVSAVPTTSAAAKTAAKNPYASYTRLDMTDFKKTAAVYSTDATSSIDCTFDNKVENSSNVPRNKLGFVVGVGSPGLLYAEGMVSLAELRRVLLHGKKYIGGGQNKYIITGVYDISKGITYNRGVHYTLAGYTFDKVNITNNPNSVIKQIYDKGFVNNPYSKTTSYSIGYPCTKIKDGGSKSSTGYVRALAFTLKKIS